MSILDLIFGSSKKIYSAQIEKIPASQFNREVRLVIDGQKTTLSGPGLKSQLRRMAQGGISITSLENKLKSMGAADNQLNRRKEIIGILKEECLKENNTSNK